jgi:hypothetical protein
MSTEINTILETYHFNTLWEMAQAAGLKVYDQRRKKLRKAALINLMRSEFFTQARVRASWEQLNERERAVVNRLLLRGGSVGLKTFQREIARARLARPGDEDSYDGSISYASGYVGSPNRPRSNVFQDVIARLTYRGLVFSRFSASVPFKIQFHPADVLYIPEVVRRYLPEPEPIQARESDWQPAHVQGGNLALLLRDLYLYWDTVRRNEVSLIQSGLVGKRWLKKINQQLIEPDATLQDVRSEDETGRLYLLRQLLEALNLVHAGYDHLRPTTQDALQIPAFWSQDHVQQLSACLQAWLKLRRWDELDDDAARYYPRYVQARQSVLEALKTLPSNVWLESDELLALVQEQNADFLFAEHSKIANHRGSWYYSHGDVYYYGNTQDLLDALEQFEDEFVRRCLEGLLRQFGLVELGCDQAGDEWQVFRLTSLGAAALGIASSWEPLADQGKVIIQPNFQVLAIGPVRLALLARLDLFAQRESVDRGAFQYRLARESVYQAQQQGMSASEVIAFLEQTSETALPQNVRRSLDEWAAHHERIVFRSGVSLLQAADGQLLDSLLNTPPVSEHLARVVAPDVVLIKKERHKQLLSALVEQGLFPATSAAQAQDLAQGIALQDDGSIQSLHAVPSLYLRGRLSRLAEKTGDGTWRLDPDLVRQVGGSKDKVLQILVELREMQRGPFPNGLADQIKAWGGYYGQAAAQTLTLIEFRDQDTLDELRARPDLRACLLPFRAGERALAVVPDDKLEYVEQILAKLGVQVKSNLRR